MNLDYYFPTPIWWCDINIDNDYLLDYCYNKRESDPDGRKISNKGGWQSQELCGDDIPELAQEAVNRASRCITDYGFNSDNTGLFFGNSWININQRGDVNQIHLHHGSFLSGVYYVKCTQDSGDIYFYRNFDQNFIATSMAEVVTPTAITSGVVHYPPKVGRLIIFPSNLLHSVESSEDDEDRISIAFNIGIKNNV